MDTVIGNRETDVSLDRALERLSGGANIRAENAASRTDVSTEAARKELFDEAQMLLTIRLTGNADDAGKAALNSGKLAEKLQTIETDSFTGNVAYLNALADSVDVDSDLMKREMAEAVMGTSKNASADFDDSILNTMDAAALRTYANGMKNPSLQQLLAVGARFYKLTQDPELAQTIDRLNREGDAKNEQTPEQPKATPAEVPTEVIDAATVEAQEAMRIMVEEALEAGEHDTLVALPGERAAQQAAYIEMQMAMQLMTEEALASGNHDTDAVVDLPHKRAASTDAHMLGMNAKIALREIEKPLLIRDRRDAFMAGVNADLDDALNDFYSRTDETFKPEITNNAGLMYSHRLAMASAVKRINDVLAKGADKAKLENPLSDPFTSIDKLKREQSVFLEDLFVQQADNSASFKEAMDGTREEVKKNLKARIYTTSDLSSVEAEQQLNAFADMLFADLKKRPDGALILRGMEQDPKTTKAFFKVYNPRVVNPMAADRRKMETALEKLSKAGKDASYIQAPEYTGPLLVGQKIRNPKFFMPINAFTAKHPKTTAFAKKLATKWPAILTTVGVGYGVKVVVLAGMLGVSGTAFTPLAITAGAVIVTTALYSGHVSMNYENALSNSQSYQTAGFAKRRAIELGAGVQAAFKSLNVLKNVVISGKSIVSTATGFNQAIKATRAETNRRKAANEPKFKVAERLGYFAGAVAQNVTQSRLAASMLLGGGGTVAGMLLGGLLENTFGHGSATAVPTGVKQSFVTTPATAPDAPAPTAAPAPVSTGAAPTAAPTTAAPVPATTGGAPTAAPTASPAATAAPTGAAPVTASPSPAATPVAPATTTAAPTATTTPTTAAPTSTPNGAAVNPTADATLKGVPAEPITPPAPPTSADYGAPVATPKTYAPIVPPRVLPDYKIPGLKGDAPLEGVKTPTPKPPFVVDKSAAPQPGAKTGVPQTNKPTAPTQTSRPQGTQPQTARPQGTQQPQGARASAPLATTPQGIASVIQKQFPTTAGAVTVQQNGDVTMVFPSRAAADAAAQKMMAGRGMFATPHSIRIEEGGAMIIKPATTNDMQMMNVQGPAPRTMDISGNQGNSDIEHYAKRNKDMTGRVTVDPRTGKIIDPTNVSTNFPNGSRSAFMNSASQQSVTVYPTAPQGNGVQPLPASRYIPTR